MTEQNSTGTSADALVRLSAAQLAEKLAAREVTAVEVTQAYLDRIAAVEAERGDHHPAPGLHHGDVEDGRGDEPLAKLLDEPLRSLGVDEGVLCDQHLHGA